MEMAGLRVLQLVFNPVGFKLLDSISDPVRVLGNPVFMILFGVKKFESDVLNLTLVAPSNSTAIDSAKLKKKYPAIAAECSK
ncbi:hypothetical protein, partial [Faecalibacterium duncaniae]|uniref:hypothetical protein n=1 Tax=Faecalibacterium duncaniae (strain DSM 17677 / JCM 31915 / A2-165) TaxID=411483 RepID=UPI00293FB0B9